jgi:DNA polymerase III subunit epsilon
MILVFDTETTGFPTNKYPANHPRQARLVQIGAALYDNDEKEVSSISLLIKPSGFRIPQAASNVHGITTEYAERYGISVKSAMSVFGSMVGAATTIAAHNLAFDLNMLSVELTNIDSPSTATITSRVKAMRQICTQRLSKEAMEIRKMPNLNEAHEYFTSASVENAHDALCDARACAAVLFKLRDIGWIL